MKFYKDENDNVFAYEDDVSKFDVKEGLVVITEDEAKELAKPKLTKGDIINNNNLIKAQLIEQANQKIEILQDIIDLDMQGNNEDEQLKAWKKYRILLIRVDTNQIEIIFPDKPSI